MQSKDLFMARLKISSERSNEEDCRSYGHISRKYFVKATPPRYMEKAFYTWKSRQPEAETHKK